MLIEDLIPFAKSEVNGPGGAFVDADDDEWTTAIVNAFWTARMWGYFEGFAVDADMEEISHISTDAEFPRALGQIIVKFVGMNALETKLANTPTSKRAKAGEVETETQRGASLLVELLKQKRRELEQLNEQLLEQFPALSGFVDLVLVRQDQALSGYPGWVN